jgi:hypothetical protein
LAPPQNISVKVFQLTPEVQWKVTEHTFYYPPALIQGTIQAEDWLVEAKARFGHAILRHQFATSTKAESQKMIQQRLIQQRQATYVALDWEKIDKSNSNLARCNETIIESWDLIKRFKTQQNGFLCALASQEYAKWQSQRERADHGIGGMSTFPAGVQIRAPEAYLTSSVSADAFEHKRQPKTQAARQNDLIQPGEAGSPTNSNTVRADQIDGVEVPKNND